MPQTLNEAGTPRFQDYAAGVLVLLGVATLGMVVLGTEWRFAGIDASVFWMWFVVSGLGLLAPIIRSIHRRRFAARQPERDQAALEAALHHPGSFCLYLRPFSSTGKLPLTLRHVLHTDGIPGYQTATHDIDEIDFETELARALEPHVNLVALGMPGEFSGAGRVKISDARWQALVVDLAQGALGIFVVPASKPGTRWELDLILGDAALRQKTVLIVPPQRIADWTGRTTGGPSLNDFERLLQCRPEQRGRILATAGPRLDALLALKAIGIAPEACDLPEGAMVRMSDPSQCAPIAEYERVSGGTLAGKSGAVLKLGLRNAINRVYPELGVRLRLSDSPG